MVDRSTVSSVAVSPRILVVTRGVTVEAFSGLDPKFALIEEVFF
jgi:hypothetical protein